MLPSLEPKEQAPSSCNLLVEKLHYTVDQSNLRSGVLTFLGGRLAQSDGSFTSLLNHERENISAALKSAQYTQNLSITVIPLMYLLKSGSEISIDLFVESVRSEGLEQP